MPNLFKELFRNFALPLRPLELKGAIAKSTVTAGIAGILACSTAMGATSDAEQLAQAQWRDSMIQTETPSAGCFQAAFPNRVWEQTPCHAVSPLAHPMPRQTNAEGAQTTGNGNDYALVAPGLITQTVGNFPHVNGVLSESSVGVALFGYGGILGANEYSLQVNTNYNQKTSACAGGSSSCTVWQQFVYATDGAIKGEAAVFIQYWLLNYRASGAACPGGYYTAGNSCYRNSTAALAPNVAASGLGSVKLSGAAVIGGNDTVTFGNGTNVYSVSAADSVLSIATVWQQSEFNVVGDAGGAEAAFSPGTSITVNVTAQYGSTLAPTCASNDGSTGETNNLSLGSCGAAGGAAPYIQFVESSPSNTLVSGETIAANQFITSPGGQFEFVLQGDGNLVLYELPNDLAIWNSGTSGKSVATCIMQASGNLVLYSPTGAEVWASSSGGGPGAYLTAQSNGDVVIYGTNNVAAWSTNSIVPTGTPATGSTMSANQVLYPGQFIKSANGHYEFTQQTDGNLVLYDLTKGTAIWNSRKSGVPVAVCIMQSDGNLVQYAAGPKAEWSSGTSGNSGAYLVVQNDGNVVIYRTNGTAAWSTGTSGQ